MKKNLIYVISGKARTGKNVVASILNELYEKENKKTVVISYASYLKDYAKKIVGWNGLEETKPREFLQNIGDLSREKNGENILIRRIIEDINIYKEYFDVIIISDARFEREITNIKDSFENVKTIHIIGRDNNLEDKLKNHITESALDSYDLYDFEIENLTSIDDLKEKIKLVVNEVE